MVVGYQEHYRAPRYFVALYGTQGHQGTNVASTKGHQGNTIGHQGGKYRAQRAHEGSTIGEHKCSCIWLQGRVGMLLCSQPSGFKECKNPKEPVRPMLKLKSSNEWARMGPTTTCTTITVCTHTLYPFDLCPWRTRPPPTHVHVYLSDSSPPTNPPFPHSFLSANAPLECWVTQEVGGSPCDAWAKAKTWANGIPVVPTIPRISGWLASSDTHTHTHTVIRPDITTDPSSNYVYTTCPFTRNYFNFERTTLPPPTPCSSASKFSDWPNTHYRWSHTRSTVHKVLSNAVGAFFFKYFSALKISEEGSNGAKTLRTVLQCTCMWPPVMCVKPFTKI